MYWREYPPASFTCKHWIFRATTQDVLDVKEFSFQGAQGQSQLSDSLPLSLPEDCNASRKASETLLHCDIFSLFYSWSESMS